MGLCVTFVSGPRRSGKSAVIRLMIDRVSARPPHYLRLVERGSGKQPPKTPSTGNGSYSLRAGDCGVASARWIEYDNDRIFETLPEALTVIHKQDRFGSVVIEADADPTLRHAYPYDHRVFVMPMPSAVYDVFRDPSRAAKELRRVLDDTQAFASEIFGLFDNPVDDDPSEERPELTPSTARGFMNSPLGDELATRIQLQPAYHGLIESDVVIVNNKIGEPTPQTVQCLKRVEKLLERVHSVSGRQGELFLCDPCDSESNPLKKLLAVLEPMCQGGT